jgi:hypothetical protein
MQSQPLQCYMSGVFHELSLFLNCKIKNLKLSIKCSSGFNIQNEQLTPWLVIEYYRFFKITLIDFLRFL